MTSLPALHDGPLSPHRWRRRLKWTTRRKNLKWTTRRKKKKRPSDALPKTNPTEAALPFRRPRWGPVSSIARWWERATASRKGGESSSGPAGEGGGEGGALL